MVPTPTLPTIKNNVPRKLLGLALTAVVIGMHHKALAVLTTVDLQSASQFAVLAGSGITVTGPTTIVGDIGTYPTPFITGSGNIILIGVNHGNDAVERGQSGVFTLTRIVSCSICASTAACSLALFFHPIIPCPLARLNDASERSMPMREKPPAHRYAHAPKNDEFISHDECRKNHQRQPTRANRRACRHTTDKKFDRRIKDGCQAEQEHGNADPDDAFQAGEFRAVFASRVLRNYG